MGHWTNGIKRVRLRTVTISVIVTSLVLLVYQIMISYKITSVEMEEKPEEMRSAKVEVLDVKIAKFSSTSPKSEIDIMPKIPTFKGTLLKDKNYIPNVNGKIFCAMDSIEIDMSRINDDYCDCPTDGMDEPGTNACVNGRFFCNYQADLRNRPKSIPSSRVNDGVCDCCDGSDEWNGFQLPNRLADDIQKSLGRFQSPCSYHC
uniref:Glucosidase II beta subunit N-terminal domain-containing protein n=1 Tax=Homalodisca liturata TaxID=320908 RepID=A0A1B6HK90_9HEMI